MNTLPTKFRLHVTDSDSLLGSLRPIHACAVELSARRWVSKITPDYRVGVGYTEIIVSTHPFDVHGEQITFRAVNTSRMLRYTKANDRGVVQNRTSFTFVRES